MIVPFILGSTVDVDHAKKIIAILNEFGVESEIYVASAHKVPTITLEILEKFNAQEGVVFVTIAGRSNALSGVVAGNTHHPVIACPPFKDKDDFIVNVNSTLQMPSETPVLTVVDTNNAALCAVRILGLSNPELGEKIKTRTQSIKSKFSSNPIE